MGFRIVWLVAQCLLEIGDRGRIVILVVFDPGDVVIGGCIVRLDTKRLLVGLRGREA